MKYVVIGVIGASHSQEIEADSIQEAIDKYEGHSGLCHSCSSEIDLDDQDGILVNDENGEQVYEDTYTREQANKNKALKEKIDELKEKIEELKDRP